MVHVSVIGCGNMGSALIAGLADGEHTLVAYDIDEAALDSVAEYCTRTTTDLETAADAPFVFVLVKPDIAPAVVDELDLSEDQTLVTFAAGVSTGSLEPLTDANVVRVMPNLAAETGDMAAAVAGAKIPTEVMTLLDEAGEFVEVAESRMDIATAVNGSGPAFVFYFIRAMRDAGIEGGLDPEDAETLAAQTFKGAAETVLQSEASIEELIEAVCSPKGTTIEGMKVLRESDADSALKEAVSAAERRSKELADNDE